MSAEEIEQDQSSTEETTEVVEETTEPTEEIEPSEEGNGEESTETTEEVVEESPELVKARKVADDQRKRAEKAEAELKKLKPKSENDRAPKKDDQANSDLQDEIVRGRLEARGVLDDEDQAYVIQAAKVLGIHPTKALDDEIVAGKLKKMRENRATKQATPAPTKRGGSSGTNDIGRLADKVAAGGELPKDPALAEKVQKEIARRSQAAS